MGGGMQRCVPLGWFENTRKCIFRGGAMGGGGGGGEWFDTAGDSSSSNFSLIKNVVGLSCPGG